MLLKCYGHNYDNKEIKNKFSLKIPSWVSTMTSLNHFLHVLSASLNLIIISITGSQFRGTLISLLNRNNEEEKSEELKSKEGPVTFAADSDDNMQRSNVTNRTTLTPFFQNRFSNLNNK